MKNRAGIWKKNLDGELEYQSFVPASLPPDPPIALDTETIELLVEANESLALLDGLSTRIPNAHLFISMYVRKEALMSSQIEGTQATLEDILDPLVSENANLDVEEVINYIKATEHAIHELTTLPLCNRLIKSTHAVLMTGVRGQEKTPGKFRRSQNWIGGAGSTLKNARYIPPNAEDMEEAMNDLESYINETDTGIDALVLAAIIHYQFETIHPFLDGNGRIGRLLVILYLIQRQILTSPVLYISYSLKLNRVEYYDRLMAVRERGDFEQWIRFFLKAILESANDAIETIDALTELRNKNLAMLNGLGMSDKIARTTMSVFHYLESNPIIDVTKTSNAIALSFNTIAGAISRLESIGIVRQSTTRKRNRLFAYTEYLEILKNGT
jgi:Fic family protein